MPACSRGSSHKTQLAIREVLEGRRSGWRSLLPLAGPAVIASIAYMDPGNYATNIQAGAKYGYGLLWVVLLSNVIAMLFQALSAKLGIVTGRNLAELCRAPFSEAARHRHVDRQRDRRDGDRSRRIPRRRHRPVASRRIFRSSGAWSSPAIVTYAILMFERRGFRPIELLIGALVVVISLCYLIEIFIVSAGLGVRRLSQRRSAFAEFGGADDRRRHHRRDRHAACDLSAFRPDAGAHAGARRRRTQEADPIFKPRSGDRALSRRRRQYGDGDDGGSRLSSRP